MVSFLIDFENASSILVFLDKVSNYGSIHSYEVSDNILTLRIKCKEIHNACVMCNTFRSVVDSLQIHCDFYSMSFSALLD